MNKFYEFKKIKDKKIKYKTKIKKILYALKMSNLIFLIIYIV